MQPLSDDQIANLDDTVRISAGGTVTSIHTDPPSFVIHATQYVMGALASDDIAIRAELSKNPKWQNPTERVPQVNSNVIIWGTLQSFETYKTSPQKKNTCAIVDVEDITYIFTPKPKSTEKPSPADVKKTKLQEKFGNRGRNRQASPPSPSSSQVKIGKRKAQSSEEEVDKDV